MNKLKIDIDERTKSKNIINLEFTQSNANIVMNNNLIKLGKTFQIRFKVHIEHSNNGEVKTQSVTSNK